jgi:hypothetical protein
MSDLSPDAVAHLWPVLTILGAVVGSVFALIAGLWVGFKWLKGQIRETAQELVFPLSERVALVEKSAEAAHRRIDEWIGARP